MSFYTKRKTKAEIMEGIESVKSWFVANNTVEYTRSNGERVIRLHLTDIVTFKPNGAIVLNSGGWQTPTTKERMNRFIKPWSVWQDKSIWYVTKGFSWDNPKEHKKHVFKDGMILHKNGKVGKAGPNTKELRKLQRKIDKYVKDYMQQLSIGEIPAPSGGDCWGCLMFDESPQADSNHILEHFEEPYFVPTLLRRAAEESNVSQAAWHVLNYLWGLHDEPASFFTSIGMQQLSKALKRYLRRRLGLAR